MRTILLLSAALALAGCGDDTTESVADLSMPDLRVPNDFPHDCPTVCAACTGGTVCVTPSGGVIPFAATCLQPCTLSADCAAGQTCVRIDNGSPRARYCVGSGLPDTCGIDCDLVPATSQCDGNDVATPYHTGVCGLQYEHCSNGCVEELPDAGFNRMAHCR